MTQKNIDKKKNKSGWALFEIPETQVDRNMPFSFDIYRFNYDGVIFLITGLIVPFVSLLLFRFVGGMGSSTIAPATNQTLSLINLLISILSAVLGGVYFFQKDRSLLFKSGLFVFYAFQILPIVVGLLFSPLFSVVNGDISSLVSLWLQILSEILILIAALFWVTDLKDRILMTLKKNWKIVLIFFVSGTLVMIGVTFFFNFIFQNTPLVGDSENQNSLTNMLESKNLAIKIMGALSLFVLTVLVAPIVEELAARQAWSIGIGNRTVAWITSAIFFAMIHVNAGDVEHILSYFFSGLVLSTVFNLGRGNVTYNWVVHGGSNLVSLIIIFATSF